MALPAIDPARLYVILEKTALRSKDPNLYQLLYNLIGNIVNLKTNTATTSSSGGSGGTIINNITQQIMQLIDDSIYDEEMILQQFISSGGTGIDTYAAPLTNGNGNLPELIFDSNGDIVMVTGLTTP